MRYNRFMMDFPYVYDAVRAEAVAVLSAAAQVEPAVVLLAEPKANIAADLAFPVFALAKQSGANPKEYARRVAEAFVPKSYGYVARADAQGGFVNLTLDAGRVALRVVREILEREDAYGSQNVGRGARLILEYSSPNIARKMHVGHLRTTVIGHSLDRIFRALGYEVIADNHLGDWGTQFGTLLAAFDAWGEPEGMDTDPIEALVQVYSRFNTAAKTDEVLALSARQWFKKLEDGDSWARATWKRLIDITMVEFERTYERLGVSFDTQHGESYYEPMLNDVVAESLEKGVAQIEPGGAVSVHFDETNPRFAPVSLPSCLLRKTDGATLYQTRDVATCIYRLSEFAPARNIYIVGAEQTLHFQQVFEITRRMGYAAIADVSQHISFGPVTDVDGARFSMRKGNSVFLDEVLDEAIARSRASIAEKIAEGKTELTPSELDSVSEQIGIGAIIYNDLYQGPERGIRFLWDKIISFEGNTALYLQYMHARCRSILRKAGDTVPDAAHADLLTTPEETMLVKQLSRLPHALREAGEKALPALIAEWTYGVAREFARFYHEHPVLEAGTPELVGARLALVQATAQSLRNGLYLLGIGAPERM